MDEQKESEVKIIDKRRIDKDVKPTKEERDKIIDKLSRKENK